MPINSKKPAPKNHRRILSLPPALDAALVKAANGDGRPVRVYATRLLAKALGVVLACLLAACSGAPTSPVEADASGPWTDAGPAACPPVGASLEEQCRTANGTAGGLCVNLCAGGAARCCYESVCGPAECPKL